MQRPHNNAGRDKDGDSGSPRYRRPPLFWTTCCGRQTHRIGANRIGDVPDPVTAERAVIEIELVPALVVHRLRDADGAGLGERLEPRGDVDAITENIVAIDDHIAKIDPDPQLQAALWWEGIVNGARRPLHLDGATQRV